MRTATDLFFDKKVQIWKHPTAQWHIDNAKEGKKSLRTI